MQEKIDLLTESKKTIMNKLSLKYKSQTEELGQLWKDVDLMRWREEQIVSCLDLDEIDLVTERLKVFTCTSKPTSAKKNKTSVVPVLDFSKIYAWRRQ